MPKRIGTGIALLADPTRRQIVALCATRPRRPSALAQLLDLSRPATTRQLRLLAEAGLLVRRRSGVDARGFLYAVPPKRIGHIIAWLGGTEVGWDGEDALTEFRPAGHLADRFRQTE